LKIAKFIETHSI